MLNIKKWFLFVLLVAVPSLGMAERVSISDVEIKSIEVYPDFRGDVVVYIDKTLPSCEHGFWLSPEDIGFNTTVSFLLSSFHAKAKIVAYGYNDQRWGGFQGNFCKLGILGLH